MALFHCRPWRPARWPLLCRLLTPRRSAGTPPSRRTTVSSRPGILHACLIHHPFSIHPSPVLHSSSFSVPALAACLGQGPARLGRPQTARRLHELRAGMASLGWRPRSGPERSTISCSACLACRQTPHGSRFPPALQASSGASGTALTQTSGTLLVRAGRPAPWQCSVAVLRGWPARGPAPPPAAPCHGARVHAQGAGSLLRAHPAPLVFTTQPYPCVAPSTPCAPLQRTPCCLVATPPTRWWRARRRPRRSCASACS